MVALVLCKGKVCYRIEFEFGALCLCRTNPANHFNRFAPEDIPYAKKREFYFCICLVLVQ